MVKIVINNDALQEKISKFINSVDILNYWKEHSSISTFNALQLAYIVYNSNKTTIEEKLEMFDYIINNCDDIILHGRYAYGARVFSLIQKYIDFQRKQIGTFYAFDENTCYTVTTYYKTSYNDFFHSNVVYSSLDIALQNETDNNVGKYKITKHRINTDDQIVAVFNENKEIINIESYVDDPTWDIDNIQFIFEYFYYSFPLPFKKGDIVTDHQSYLTYKECNDVFVIDKILDYDKEYRNKHLEYGDPSDMIALCYQQYDGGEIIYDHRHNLLNYEYYHGDLGGEKRILKLISLYLKEEIDIELLVIAYHQILNEEAMKRSRTDIGWFTKEALELVGLE